MDSKNREEFLKRENEMLNRHKWELTEKVWALESENKRLREALGYYADKNHYEYYCLGEPLPCDVTEDGGYIARQTLEGE